MPSNRKEDVLFALKVPPPFGGGEIEHQIIYDVLQNNHLFLRFSRKSHTKAKQGRILLSNFFYGLLLMLQIWGTCAIRRPKVVFIWLPKDFPAFVRTILIISVLRLFRIKVIGDLHGMGFRFLNRRLQKWYYRRHINLFTTIRVLSPRIGERIRDSGFRHNIVSMDNGIVVPNLPKNKTGAFIQPIKLLYLGAISEAKGFLRVLHLIRDLSRANIRFILQVAGEWVNEQFHHEAVHYVEEHHLAPYIQFLGRKLNDEKWRILWNSHLLLHFTIWDGQPLTIIEAMAVGVPTISTPVGAIPDMIEHNVNGFLIDRVDQSIHIIIELLASRLDYEAISFSARRTYERRFTVERYIDGIQKIITMEKDATGHSISKNR